MSIGEKQINTIIRYLKENLYKNRVSVTSLILFGSAAEGKQSKHSDIDILLISNDFNKKSIFERADITRDAEISTIKNFMVPLDIINLTPSEYDNSIFKTFPNNKIYL